MCLWSTEYGEHTYYTIDANVDNTNPQIRPFRGIAPLRNNPLISEKVSTCGCYFRRLARGTASFDTLVKSRLMGPYTVGNFESR